jgi:hypothetical protein
MERGSDTAMELKMDKKDYSDDELISIKTKLNLPYYSSSPHFERTYGSVTLDGIVYEYVQKRVFNDTLELLCLPNSAKTALHGIKNELTKSSADGQASVPVKKGTTTLKISLPDFCQTFEPASAVVNSIHTNYLLQNDSFSLSDFTKQQERPPQAI